MDKGYELARAYGYGGTEEDWRARASMVVSSTPPKDPAFGDIWVNPVTGTVEVEGGSRTQSEDVGDGWKVPGDSINQTFDTREKALVRAWEITPAGQQRPEPVALGAALRVDDVVGSRWVAENTLRWVGYVEPMAGQSERIHQCMQLAMADMVIRAGETGEVLDLETVRSYSFYDADKDQYRVEITVKVTPE